jgi:hypothetical protein
MPLEDHLGDVLAKARAMTDVTLETAAEAAGLPVARYEEIERSGRLPGPLNLAPLARMIELDPAKLHRLAAGWLPQPRELGQWRHLHQITTAHEGQHGQQLPRLGRGGARCGALRHRLGNQRGAPTSADSRAALRDPFSHPLPH